MKNMKKEESAWRAFAAAQAELAQSTPAAWTSLPAFEKVTATVASNWRQTCDLLRVHSGP